MAHFTILPFLEPIKARPVKLTAPELQITCLDDCARWVGEPCDCWNSRRRELERESAMERDRR